MTGRNLGSLIFLDGLAVAHCPGGPNEAFGWLLKHQGQSVDYATTHGGYSIVDDNPEDNAAHLDFRGWVAFLSTPYNPTDKVLIQLIRGVLEFDASRPDYLIQGEVIRPMIDAARMLLNYTSSPLDLINGRLSEQLDRIAALYGVADD